MRKFESLFDELIKGQQQVLLETAREIIPQITEEDLLQPFDFPQLEHNAAFRYEEGLLAGLLTARMALLAAERS